MIKEIEKVTIKDYKNNKEISGAIYKDTKNLFGKRKTYYFVAPIDFKGLHDTLGAFESLEDIKIRMKHNLLFLNKYLVK